VKYARFRELCEREWDRDCGDVLALSLTGPSAAELADDLLGERDVVRPVLYVQEELAPGNAFARGRRAWNPVTLSVVTIGAGADSDTATVRYGPDGSLRAVAASLPEGAPA